MSLVACGTRPPPEHFDVGSGGATATDAAPPVCRMSSDPSLDTDSADAPCGDVPTSVFQRDCNGGSCHHPEPMAAADLDLVSPCVADRLIGVASTCNGKLLVDPARPSSSFLLEKLETTKPECGGASMPFGALLPASNIACVTRWVNAVVHESQHGPADAGGDATAPSDAGGDATSGDARP